MQGKSRKKEINNSIKNNNAATLDDSFIIVEKKEDKEKIGLKKKKLSLKFIAICAFVIVLLATIFFALRFVSFETTDMLWKKSVTRGSSDVNNKSIRYQSFKNGLFRISNDGLTYINDSGDIKYAISYNMVNPIYETAGEFFAIADRNAFDFYIFDKDGLVGKNTAKFPIQKISLSNIGVLYILETDENSSYVHLYRKNGNPIDISIKSNFTGDGMPIDLSVSPDGTELLLDYTCLDSNLIFSKATYYNFDDIGKNADAKRIVGEFKDELKDKFLARVHFFDDERSCLISDTCIFFVSTSVLNNPNITSKITIEDKIKSISYNENYLVLVFEDNKMQIINKNGDTKVIKQLDYDYDNFYLSDDYIIFLYGNRAMIYDTNGRLIFDKELESGVQYIAKKKSLLFTELLLGLIDGVECIRFY